MIFNSSLNGYASGSFRPCKDFTSSNWCVKTWNRRCTAAQRRIWNWTSYCTSIKNLVCRERKSFGVKKFKQFLLGHKFTLISDHKPLLSIFNSTKGSLETKAARLQRRASLLMGYDYEILYKKSSLHGNADSLSRLPVPGTALTILMPKPFMHCEEAMQDIAIDSAKIQMHIKSVPLLMKIIQYVKEEWPKKLENKILKPYVQVRNELSYANGCLFRNPCRKNVWCFFTHGYYWVLLTWVLHEWNNLQGDEFGGLRWIQTLARLALIVKIAKGMHQNHMNSFRWGQVQRLHGKEFTLISWVPSGMRNGWSLSTPFCYSHGLRYCCFCYG